MTKNDLASIALEEGKGILRLAPVWVPRSFCRPGKRLKLHPDDYYSYGAARGAIDERWLSSTTPADNGPETSENEGLSYIVANARGDKILLRDVINELKGAVIGDSLWAKYGCWSMYSKFFDNLGPLPHHIHHMDRHAKLVGLNAKPEMYFYPAQMNNHPGEFAYTFFGLNPGVTKAQLRETLVNFTKGDNRITELSRAYKLTLDTGWDVPSGVLHAPGSLCTYEPQFASDVFAMFQSVLFGEHVVSGDLLWKNCPDDKLGDYDYLVDLVDWEINVDPDFVASRKMQPIPINAGGAREQGYLEEWICYKCECASAKRLTVAPGQKVTVRDAAAYGMILLQGRGAMGVHELETPTLIRFGGDTFDEYFVTESAARAGVEIENRSSAEPLVMLKHFSDNPDLPSGL
jgi:hypothetical protein